MSMDNYTQETKDYLNRLKTEVEGVYEMANEARALGYDPMDEVEIPIAMSMAEKVVGLISTVYPQMLASGIAERILELEEEFGKLDPTVIFKIADEISDQKFCEFESIIQAMDAGIRVGLCYTTLGVVSSPIEGYTGIEKGKTREGKDYIIANFSGPIRSAGTTASCMVLFLIDFLREKFGFAKYDPNESEIRRVWTELSDFHDRITNLQYMPTEEEAIFLAKNMPFQIAGDPSEKLEVSNYKNLERVNTNFLRSGVCLVYGEGLAQKAPKGFRLYNMARENGIKATGFDWIEEYLEILKKKGGGKGKKSGGKPTYIKDLVAGRPVYGHPGRSGSFRFRYGRGRNSGFSAVCIHPATMGVSDDFLATGTQLKIEKPTKGCAIAVSDSIDGPIVKLKNGSVKQLNTKEEARELYKNIEEIIYLGDILFPHSDVVNRASDLLKPGYVEEWWALELRKKDSEFEKGIDFWNVEFDEAVGISEKYDIPLYPKFIYYWTEISKEEFFGLINWLRHSWVDGKLILPYTVSDKEKFVLGKRALELLGVPHEVTIENVVLDEVTSKALLVNLGIDVDWKVKSFLKDLELKMEGEEVLDLVNSNSKFVIKDKAGEFIGARMGRPEKAKLRIIPGSPNSLFAVGREGGRMKTFKSACEKGSVSGQFPIQYCSKCEKETIFRKCDVCDCDTETRYYFRDIKEKANSETIEYSDLKGVPYQYKKIDINHYFDTARKKLGFLKTGVPDVVKGIFSVSSGKRINERIEKGILRAKHGLQVFRDGTVRMDATELPIVSFKPKEIGTSVEKLHELGYHRDVDGKEIVSDEQIIEMKPHDVLIPSSPETPDEKGEDVFVSICNFIDELLVKFYGLKPYYNIKSKEDLIGQLGVCMAPHNCAGVACRFIGFSNTLGLMASPYMHAAIRRDCFDYDTFMPIKKNGNWEIAKIGEVVKNVNPTKVVDSFGTKEKDVDGFETVGFSNKLEEVKVNNFSCHTKIPFFEIKTALGKKIKVTENHKFFVDGKIKRASTLKIGDKLPLPRRIEIESRKLDEINLLEYLKDENLMICGINGVLVDFDSIEKEKILVDLGISKKQFMNFKLRDSYPISFVSKLNEEVKAKICDVGRIALKRDNVDVPIRIVLNDELLEVIGLYVAEGFSRKIVGKKGLNQVYISSNDSFIRSFVRRVIKNSFGLIPSENKNNRVTFSSGVLYLFFMKILKCGGVAREKRIPSLFLDLPLNKLASVLRGYYEGDGSVSKGDIRVSCDTVSEGLLCDLEFCLARFGIFAKRYEYEKEPGPLVREFYIKKKRKVPKFRITKLIIGSDFLNSFFKIGFLSERKKEILDYHRNHGGYGMRINYDKNFVYDPIVSIESLGERESYCLNVDSDNHLVVANSIVSKNCDGDEAALMLLGDVLLNFSRKYLPDRRGATQDAPLVMNVRIDAGEVDDQILDFEYVNEYPLELYELAEKGAHSSEVKMHLVRDVLKEESDPFVNMGFTHDTTNFNDGVVCSAYKLLGDMAEKVGHQMELCEKLRSVDTQDTARLVIERHFIRDMRGNLRKFSMQGFRCVDCNEIHRRPPLSGKCSNCNGKLIFTIHEGGIKKYLEPALELGKKYNVSPYLQQVLELVKGYIDSIFGKEKEKQTGLDEYF